MCCVYEGKCFAFIHLHKTKTTCFGTDLVYTATRNDTLSQTKTTCFGMMKAYEGKNFAFIGTTH